jgi:hypothetical protein
VSLTNVCIRVIISAEAVSFLERRCRFPAQKLSKAIPQARNDAIELIEALLSMDPSGRPSAEAALTFGYLSDCTPLTDYSSVHLERASSEYFDFELEKHELASLKAMIVSEVGIATDRVPTARPQRVIESLATAEVGAEVGPLSQMKTQRAGTSLAQSNPYAAKTNPFAAVAKIAQSNPTSVPNANPFAAFTSKPSRGSSEGKPPVGKEVKRRPSQELRGDPVRDDRRRRSFREGEVEGVVRRRPSTEADDPVRELDRALQGARISALREVGSGDNASRGSGLLSQFQTSYRSLSAQMADRAAGVSRLEKPSTTIDPAGRVVVVRLDKSKPGAVGGRVLPNLSRR